MSWKTKSLISLALQCCDASGEDELFRPPVKSRAMTKKAAIRLKRVYEPAAAEDGLRVLVDRLWPRGLAKEKAAVDHWLKEAAPSTALRQWFGHDPARWPEFRERYRAELRENPTALAALRRLCRGQTVTLLYAASDPEHNNAVVLKTQLEAG
jgi:uncharacterized protein YeaO (DUF488 family)